MKTYTTPVLTDLSLGEVEIDGVTHEVTGIIPFLAAAAAAAAAVATAAEAVGKATDTFDDSYTDYTGIHTLKKIKS